MDQPVQIEGPQWSGLLNSLDRLFASFTRERWSASFVAWSSFTLMPSPPSLLCKKALTVQSRPFFWLHKTPRYCNSANGCNSTGQVSKVPSEPAGSSRADIAPAPSPVGG